jgi:hypothetical protein
MNFSANDSIQQQIRFIYGIRRSAKEKHTSHPQACGGDGRTSGVVGLNSSACDNGIATLPPGLCQKKFQLPNLISGRRGPGQIIAFDENVGRGINLTE